MHEVEHGQHQDSRAQLFIRHIASLAVGAIAYFAGKEIGLGEPAAAIVGLVGAVATSSIIGYHQARQGVAEYPPNRHLDI